MLRYKVKCDNKPVILKLGVAVQQPTKVAIRVFNPTKKHTIYMDRYQTVKSKAEFDIRLPQNCKEVIVEISTPNSSNDDGIRITKFKKGRIDQYAPCIAGGYKLKSFIKFAQFFAENAGDLPIGTYYSDDKLFRIDYLDTIHDSNRSVNTPARISNLNGRMEVHRQKFMAMTVPMRMAILLHEYSHFNMNEVQTDEIEADLNALKVYLGLGYPVIEAHKSFLHVFQQSPTQENRMRYEQIKTFIDNFDNIKYQICMP